MKNLPINSSVALVFGAAGFIGSHLVEKLLNKDVAVIGVDNLSSGKKQSLTHASKQRHFYPFYQSGTDALPEDIAKVDYAFFVVDDQAEGYKAVVDNFLNLVKKFKPKVVLVSSIDQYDNKDDSSNLKYAESKITEISKDNKINTRIVRLAHTYGPRMNFNQQEGLGKLIKLTLTNNLTQHHFPLDFTIRSLYIDDAIDLLIKATLHSGTAQKLYDGSLLNPIKLDELKQILINPSWFESTGLNLTQLPAWPTPNLVRTQNELRWIPKINLFSGLKQTIKFFKDNPEYQKEEELQPLNHPGPIKKIIEEIYHPEYLLAENADKPKKGSGLVQNIHLPKLNLASKVNTTKTIGLTILGVVLITLALILPSGRIILAGLSLDNQLGLNNKNLALNNYSQAKNQINESQKSIEEIKSLVDSLNFLTISDTFDQTLISADQFVQLLSEATEATDHFNEANKNLTEALNVTAGKSSQNIEDRGEQAIFHLIEADRLFSHLKSRLDDQLFLDQMPNLIKPKVEDLKTRINWLYTLTSQLKPLSQLLNLTILSQEKASYLVLIEDPNVLSSGGGMVRSYAVLDFDKGKLTKIKFEQPDWILSDANHTQINNASYDLDFTINAKRLESLYKSKFNKSLNGVLALDVEGLKAILKYVGPVEVEGVSQPIDVDNFNQTMASLSDTQQMSKLSQAIFEKLIYLDNPKWPEIIGEINQLLYKKQFLIYTKDSKSQSLLRSYGWMGEVPKLNSKVGEANEFLSIVETGKSGQILTNIPSKTVKVNSQIRDEGLNSQEIEINYQEVKSLFESRIYLPIDANIKKITLGDEDITSKVKRISDYGKSGLIITIDPTKNPTSLVRISLEQTQFVDFDDKNQARINMILLKQPGSQSYPFEYQLTLPDNIKVESQIGFKVSGNVLTFKQQSDSDLKASVILKNNP